MLKKAIKIAIDDILESNIENSKFGYFLSERSLIKLKEDLYQLFSNSLDFRINGDKFIDKGISKR